MNIANESQKEPFTQRASKAPFLMEIIWSILRSAFCQDEKCSDRLCPASRPFFLEQRRIELLLAHFTRCF